MKKRNKLILTAILSLGLIGTVVAKQGGHHFHKDKIVEKLDLTPAQTDNLDVLIEQFKSQHPRKKHRSHGKSPMMFTPEEISTLLKTDQLDQAAALEIVDAKLAKLRSQAEELIQVTANFTNSLNSEQRAKIQQIMAERAKKREQRHQDS